MLRNNADPRRCSYFELGLPVVQTVDLVARLYWASVCVVACVAWRFCRAGRTSGEAARKIKTACPDSPPPSTHFDIPLTTCLVFKLLPPQSPRGFSALARLYYLARPAKTAMLRRLCVWIPADVVLVTRFPSNCQFFNEMVACVVSRIVLQGYASCEFETRTLNPERVSHFLADFFAFIALLTLSLKLQIGMQFDSSFNL